MRIITTLFVLFMLCGCQPDSESEPQGGESASAQTEQQSSGTPSMSDETQAAPEGDAEPAMSASDDGLTDVLASQSQDIRSRYDDRHPAETLSFFGIEPGMTVVEAVPGGGWYTKILLPYLGSDGELIAANYPLDMWPYFSFADEDFMAEMEQWPESFPEQAGGWCEDDCASVSTFWFGDMPAEIEGQVDAVLFVRMLHNMARFQNQGIDNYVDQAFADAHAALKPGGILGVVQHEAREDTPDEWANGAAGYLKKAFVIERAEAAGVELVNESDVNANPNDKPTTDDVVWRLPPSLSVPEDAENAESLRAQYEAIGESNRMTLKFRKPAAD